MLRSDVEGIFRQIAAEVAPAIPYGARTVSSSRIIARPVINQSIENMFNYIEVSSLRTGGKRVVGKRISVYVAIVVSLVIFAYKFVIFLCQMSS